jgi:hypothetical protein
MACRFEMAASIASTASLAQRRARASGSFLADQMASHTPRSSIPEWRPAGTVYGMSRIDASGRLTSQALRGPVLVGDNDSRR